MKIDQYNDNSIAISLVQKVNPNIVLEDIMEPLHKYEVTFVQDNEIIKPNVWQLDVQHIREKYETYFLPLYIYKEKPLFGKKQLKTYIDTFKTENYFLVERILNIPTTRQVAYLIKEEH